MLGLNTWPDGNIGVVPTAAGYGFYAADGSHGVYTTGTIASPGGAAQSVSITDPLNSYNYMSGGPVYEDPASGRLLMFYHAEIDNPSAQDFYSVLGLAISTNASNTTFRDLGPVVESSVSQAQAAGHAVDLEGSSYVVNNGNFYVYFHDYNANGTQSNTAVAEAAVSTVVANALANQSTPFEKYYNGSFSQPGINGLSSPLETGNPTTNWSSVSYDSYINKYVMAVAQTSGSNVNLYLTTSTDGLTWGPRQLLEGGSGELFYPTIVGAAGNDRVTSQTFDVYYTSSQLGGFNRWTDASLMHVSVTTPISGDANYDGIVNGQDIALVASEWLRTGNGLPGDVNFDGTVNGQDIAMIASNWLQTGGAGTAIVVAEPSALFLAVLGSLASLARRRRSPRRAAIGVQ